MKILNLKEIDVEKHSKEIVCLFKQSYMKSFPDKKIEDSYFENRVKVAASYISMNKAKVYGAIIEEKLTGFIWFFEKNHEIKQTIHINHFVVNENFRRLGIGKKLWLEVERYAEKSNIKEIELYVTRENHDAVKFYENMNFEVERYVMNKRLKL